MGMVEKLKAYIEDFNGETAEGVAQVMEDRLVIQCRHSHYNNYDIFIDWSTEGETYTQYFIEGSETKEWCKVPTSIAHLPALVEVLTQGLEDDSVEFEYQEGDKNWQIMLERDEAVSSV